jgi:hypothetical protein
MEIRLVNESAGVVGHVTIKYNNETDMWEVTPYFDNSGGVGDTEKFPSESSAFYDARGKINALKYECEEDFRKRYSKEPVGVMSETGFTIQEVEGE